MGRCGDGDLRSAVVHRNVGAGNAAEAHVRVPGEADTGDRDVGAAVDGADTRRDGCNIGSGNGPVDRVARERVVVDERPREARRSVVTPAGTPEFSIVTPYAS